MHSIPNFGCEVVVFSSPTFYSSVIYTMYVINLESIIWLFLFWTTYV